MKRLVHTSVPSTAKLLTPKEIAVQELGSLMNGPIPKTQQDFRRAILMASIIGQSIMEHQTSGEYICKKCGLRQVTG